MSTRSSTDAVRDLIKQTFKQLGLSTDEPLRETILIRDGHFCGRRFCQKESQAIWFVEENEIKFYDDSGTFVKVVAGMAAEGLKRVA